MSKKSAVENTGGQIAIAPVTDNGDDHLMHPAGIENAWQIFRRPAPRARGRR
jgi:hypothetical protein